MTDGDAGDGYDSGDGARIVHVSDDANRRYPASLSEEEIRGGHTLREHVGKTDAQMLARIQTSERGFPFDFARRAVETLGYRAPEPDITRHDITRHGRQLTGTDLRRALDTPVRFFDRIAVPERGRYVEYPATEDDGPAYRMPSEASYLGASIGRRNDREIFWIVDGTISITSHSAGCEADRGAPERRRLRCPASLIVMSLLKRMWI